MDIQKILKWDITAIIKKNNNLGKISENCLRVTLSKGPKELACLELGALACFKHWIKIKLKTDLKNLFNLFLI